MKNGYMEEIAKIVITENAQTFSERVDKLVSETGMRYMDAIVTLQERMGYDVESIKQLLTSDMKAKLSEEAQSLFMVKKDENTFETYELEF